MVYAIFLIYDPLGAPQSINYSINATITRFVFSSSSWFPTRCKKRVVQPQKMDRGLSFRIYEVEGLYSEHVAM